MYRHCTRALSAAAVVCCIVLGSTAVAAGSGPRKLARTCTPRGAQTIARTGGTRLYRIGGGGGGEYSSPSTIYVCERSRKRQVRLLHIPAANSALVTKVRFSGRYVAFDVIVGDETCAKYNTDPSVSCSTESLRSYNVRTGKLRVNTTDTSDALALASNGWIAWVPPATSSGAPRSLLAIDSSGRHQLDTGAIDPASLTATATTIHWTNAGVQRSAVLG